MLSYLLLISIITLLVDLCQTVNMGTQTYTISGSSYQMHMPFVVIYAQTATLTYVTTCSRLSVWYYNCCTTFATFEEYSSGTKTQSTSFVVGTDFIGIDSPTSGCTTSLTLVLNFDCATIDTKCDACNSYTSCTSCITGYYASATAPKCKQCTIANCVQCSEGPICITCTVGYAPNASGQCDTCGTLMNQCQSCTSNTTCTACTSNSMAVKTTGGCQSCQLFPGMDKCTTCSNNNTCITCTSTQYALNTALKCVLCSSITNMQNCQACTSNTICTTCTSDQFTLDAASKCVSCSTFPGMLSCATCSGSGTCLTCVSNFYALDAASKCLLCSTFSGMANCQSCASNSTCTACTSTNFALTTFFKCALCSGFMSNCQTCSSNNTCLTCSSTNYAINTNARCALCSSFPVLTNCQTCSNNVTCTLCSTTNYALDATAKCSLCPSFSGMSNCQNCSSNSTCTICVNTNYALNPGLKCALCSTLITNCQTCSNNVTCTMCSSTNYALDALAKCALCSTFAGMSNCQTCSNNSTCTACVNTNYALNAAAKCNLCASFTGMSNCQTCTNNSTCTACTSTAYALDAGAKCRICSNFVGMDQCQTCSNNNTCLTCSSTMYALNFNAKCSLCNNFAVLSNCKTCSNNFTCTGCISTQYVLNSLQRCELCSVPYSNCFTCNSPIDCISCNIGYAFDVLGLCLKCVTFLSNCLTCSSNTTCLTCDPGFTIDAAQCKTCSQLIPNCNQCLSNKFCSLCQPGYAVDSGKCKKCNSFMVHCSLCSNKTTCTACQDPYDVGIDQTCTKCKLPLFYAHPFCISDENCVSSYKTLNNVVVCTFCDASKHYILDHNQKCICKKGFHDVGSGCEEICGDGMIFVTQCDDNNTKDNDGCSSSCKLEADFLCTEKKSGATKCKLNKNVVLKLDYVDKIISENKALIYISVNSDNPNVHAYYRSLLFDYNVTSNRSDTITILGKTMNENGQIMIEIEYVETIEDSMMKLSFIYEKEHLISQDHMLRFQLKGRNYALVISGYIDKYQEIYKIQVYVVICYYVFVVVFLLSDKFIAVEGLNSLQMVYFSLLLIIQNSKWPQAFSTILPLKYSMGFNQLIYEEKSQANIADITFNKYRYIGMSESFIMNNLTNSAVLMVLSFFFLVLYAIKTQRQQQKNQSKDQQVRKKLRKFLKNFRRVYKKLYNMTFHFSYIMIYQLFVSLYIETAYMKQISFPVKILSKFCAIYLFVTIIFTVLENFNHFFLSNEDTAVENFRVGKVEARYKAIYLSYLLINVVCVVLLNNKLFFGISVSVFLLFLAVIYLIFLILYRPYQYSFTVHTFTIIANQLIYMLTLWLITLVNFEIKLEEDYLLMFCYTLMGFCMVMFLLTVVRVYLDFRFGASQVQEEVNKEIKEIEEIEKNAFVKLPKNINQLKINDKMERTLENPYTIENQVLIQQQIDFLNELMKKKFLSQWQRDQAYHRHYKMKPLQWVKQNEKQIKYEYLLEMESEAFQKNVYKQKLKMIKEQKAADQIQNEKLRNLKSKMRMDFQAKKEVSDKKKLQKRRKRKQQEQLQKTNIESSLMKRQRKDK